MQGKLYFLEKHSRDCRTSQSHRTALAKHYDMSSLDTSKAKPAPNAPLPVEPHRKSSPELDNCIATSATQTSKTILQLAQLQVQDKYPDSLNGSPRKESDANSTECPDALQFIRKTSLLKLISEYRPRQGGQARERTSVCSKKSLIQVFLEKKRHTLEGNLGPSAYCSSSFTSQRFDCLQEPIKPLTSRTMPQLDSCKDRSKKSTRFTVKNVRQSVREGGLGSGSPIRRFAQATSASPAELFPGDIPRKIVEFYTNPWQKRVERKRRSNSFMGSTFASEQRTQNQVGDFYTKTYLA